MQSVVASTANELLLKFRDGPESFAAATGHALVGAEVVRTFREVGWQMVKLPTGMNVDEAMAAYKGLGSVLTVEPNGAIRAEMREDQSGFVEHYDFAPATDVPVIPNDPQFGGQWALRKIGATNAWAITKGSGDVVVAIIDTGVNYKHEDLRENMWRNPGETGIDEHGKDKATNGIDDDENGYADDVHGIDPAGNDSDPMDEGVSEPRIYHGTFVAGQIAAVGNNGKGICGINWTAQVMAIRISQVNDVFRAADVLEAFDYVVKMKRRGVNIRVTNNSYGGDNPGEAIRDAMEIAGKEGVLHVCAAGNAGVNMDYTSAYPRNYPLGSIIVVTASNESDQLVLNYGATMVDLAAPASNLRSTYGPHFNSYFTSSGAATSFAAPQVTGAAALLLSADPTLSMEEVKTAILGSVDVLPSMRGRVLSNGRLNVGRALQTLNNSMPPIVISTSPWVVKDRSNTRLSVIFSKPMDRASLEGAWQISPGSNGRFEWDAAGVEVSFIPTEPLIALTNYTVTILGTARDLTGESLDGNYDRASEGSSTDDFQWSFRLPPANDDVYYAELIEGRSGQVSGTNINASLEGRELDKAGNPGGASVWYRWVAPESGPMTFETKGSSFDTLLAVGARDANSLEQDIIRAIPTFITANDNFGTLKTSRVNFTAKQGNSYVIGVDGKALAGRIPPAATGDFILSWFPTPQTLSYQRLAGGGLQLSWTASAPGYVLESASTLDPQAWMEAPQAPVLSGSRKVVNLNPEEIVQFYRLRKP